MIALGGSLATALPWGRASLTALLMFGLSPMVYYLCALN